MDHGLDLDRLLHERDVRAHSVRAWKTSKGKQILRGPLSKFIHFVEIGTIKRGSWLLVEDIDRLTRQNHTNAYMMCLRLMEAGTTIATLMDGEIYTIDIINTDTGKRDKLVHKLDSAHEYSEKLSFRLRANKEHKRERAISGEAIVAGRTGPLW